ncbi:HTH-type transcriptional regulator HdfR [Aliivibrio fischeri]|uniref:HTH-type transcriptional regulator HdfR n=1 Tax=Aliivibrio fischeri TaxID=668 RepID=UPI0007C587B6|nr:HTH-type transcriptional regulator HdfR [Aliivibrio fischeri]MBP3139727.1 HTH-type transcriptional regulator HdfR [Aliivibrio fischeri]MBP3154112.1 HTH-type transcriptional regulator HdfR [Aliivibrio fischeri]MCE7554917.1 HTH-type transcriptional regulator HdfR [Aliivibrio fischeri]MCE7562185.1 HTH-type transcriptional regulator HdfR [Aliivibrio fischeri]MCE7569593.1 HTH-type transcriptional regulator HdfR [Aliivibrio fischeri]
MDTDLLKTFLEVTKTRHFGRAAEHLFLTQSAVSFRVRQLESQLGNPLFTRQRHNVQLTAAGERLLPYAEAILQTWGRAKQDVALTEDYNSQITIGASTLIWEFDGISDWINGIYDTISGLALRLESIPRQELAKALLEKSVDLFITSEPPKIDGIRVFKIRDYQLQLVSSTPNSTMETIQSMPLVYLDWGARFAIQHSKIAELQKTPILHTHSSKMALDYLMSHSSIGYLPAPVINQSVDNKELYVVEGAPIMEQELYLVWQEKSEKAELIDQITNIKPKMVTSSV